VRVAIALYFVMCSSDFFFGHSNLGSEDYNSLLAFLPVIKTEPPATMDRIPAEAALTPDWGPMVSQSQ